MKKTLYNNIINLSGLYSLDPVKMKFNKGLDLWVDNEGFSSSTGPGLKLSDSCVSFSSHNKKEVELWTSGIKCSLKLLNAWSSRHA